MNTTVAFWSLGYHVSCAPGRHHAQPGREDLRRVLAQSVQVGLNQRRDLRCVRPASASAPSDDPMECFRWNVSWPTEWTTRRKSYPFWSSRSTGHNRDHGNADLCFRNQVAPQVAQLFLPFSNLFDQRDPVWQQNFGHVVDKVVASPGVVQVPLSRPRQGP
jgi:hypothetical protein